ncbi:MAG TPA: IclR family transcriptional regulator [Desulfuromonas sp.]|nr:IclR family transcriptional regulator [Desulfuromonas sp.]
MTPREKESYSIQSVEHALDLLEALCDQVDGVQIAQLSTRLGMNKSSIFRLLATLEARGYVQREESSKRYRLGMTAYETAQKFLSHMTLLRKARPVMERLARLCDEAVYLAIRRGDEVLFLDMIDTGQQVKLASLVGRRYPLTALSAGRALLAFDDDRVIRPRSVPRPPPLDAIVAMALERFRRTGFGADVGGGGEGVTCLAVPLFNHREEIEGTLAILGPDFRLGSETRQLELRTQLLEAAGVISSGMGYFGYFERARQWTAAMQ